MINKKTIEDRLVILNEDIVKMQSNIKILEQQKEFLPENIQWLGLGNKYLECQYEITDDWGTKGLDKKDSYDTDFQNEYDFVLDNMKLRG